MKRQGIVLLMIMAAVSMRAQSAWEAIGGPSPDTTYGEQSQIRSGDETRANSSFFDDVIASGSRTYAASGSDLYRSTDGGKSWSAINGELMIGRGMAISGDSLFAFGEAGLYCTTNDGEDWMRLPDVSAGATIVDIAVRSGYLIALDSRGVLSRLRISPRVLSAMSATDASTIAPAPNPTTSLATLRPMPAASGQQDLYRLQGRSVEGAIERSTAPEPSIPLEPSGHIDGTSIASITIGGDDFTRPLIIAQ